MIIRAIFGCRAEKIRAVTPAHPCGKNQSGDWDSLRNTKSPNCRGFIALRPPTGLSPRILIFSARSDSFRMGGSGGQTRKKAAFAAEIRAVSFAFAGYGLWRRRNR